MSGSIRGMDYIAGQKLKESESIDLDGYPFGAASLFYHKSSNKTQSYSWHR